MYLSQVKIFNRVTIHLENVDKLILYGPKVGKLSTYVNVYFWYMALINTQMPWDVVGETTR